MNSTQDSQNFINFGINEAEMDMLLNSSPIEVIPADGRAQPSKVIEPSASGAQSSTSGAQASTSASASHICNICQRTYRRRAELNRHKKIHEANTKIYTCEFCQSAFRQASDLRRHMLSHENSSVQHQCDVCGQLFNRKDHMLRHLLTHTDRYSCEICSEKFSRREYYLNHMKVYHPKRKAEQQGGAAEKKPKSRSKPAAQCLNIFAVHLISPSPGAKDLLVFLQNSKSEVIRLLNDEMEEKMAIKWYLTIQVILTRVGTDGEDEFIYPHFRSKCMVDLMGDTIPDRVDEGVAKIIASFGEFMERGSNWVLDGLRDLEIHVGRYHPLRASSYIPLPAKLASKKAVLNIQNEDQKCLVWCLIAHKMNISRESNPHRVNHYLAHEQEIRMGDVECPVSVTHIPKIERLNNLRINVFGYENGEVMPMYVSEREDEDCINLLLISNTENEHYCLIRSMSRLLGDLTHHNPRSFYCYRCLHRFSREPLLKDHLQYCKSHALQRIKMPSEEERMLAFTKLNFQHPVPFIIYADFEAMIVPISSCARNNSDSSVEKIAHHEACGYAYIIVDEVGRCIKPISVYRGENAVSHFLEAILQEKEELAQKLLSIQPLSMSWKDNELFQRAIVCSICGKDLGTDRVRDHCHLTGQFRGAAHSKCNVMYRLSKKIPVVFHNLKKYDGHLIMQGLGEVKEHNFNVIANNMENYISFSLKKKYGKVWIDLQFIDSLQFLNTSLQKLVENLPKDRFNILKENIAHAQYELLLRKGVYPYDYVDDIKKFEDTVLPPREAFYNKITSEAISPEDYSHAQNVWSIFNIQTLGEYHDLYVKSDVLQLADVFQNFRTLCKKFYDLDCAHVMTSPGLAWQACIKMSHQPLELLTDINMHLFIERGIRGGVSMISKRLATANNPYMQNYDASKPTSYILYLDANNLYGWAMSQPLPYGDFKWVDPTDEIINHILSLPEDSTEGYVLEIDINYPSHLHPSHNDLPVLAEKKKIDEEDLSPYAKHVLHSKFVPTTKLITDFKPKINYVVYHRNLQLYLSLGLELIKVHKILKFSQKPWLQQYVEFNTNQRKLAKSTFEKNFFKLMNNSVYGKTMENVRGHIDVQLVNNRRRGEKLLAAPTFKSFKIFNENLTGVQRTKSSITLNKPIYVGFVILELSKLHMYRFHYQHIKKTYGEKACLLFTDTDSLTYEIHTEDVYKDMLTHKHLFDTSDYPEDHPCYSTANKKKMGCFKDELNGKPAVEFVGLRAKMYSLLTETDEKKTLKGVCSHVVRKKIRHADYKACLLNNTHTRESQFRFLSDCHRIYTSNVNKVALSSFDDKRYLHDDGIQSYAYGHIKIQDLKMNE